MVIGIFSYFLIINLISGYLMLEDKRRAIAKSYRIPESNLLFLCIVGGFFGTYWGMQTTRHKTQHWAFHLAVIASFFFWLFVLPLGIYWIYK